MCQKWKLRLTSGSNGIVATGSRVVVRVEEQQLDARRVLREEGEVHSSVVHRRAERLAACPRSNVGRRSATERRRVLLVRVALVELNDVSFRVGNPGDAHPFDELAHVERAERDLRVVSQSQQASRPGRRR